MKITEYLKESRSELKHVSWPTKRQTITFTAVVIVVSIATSLYLGLFDLLFTYLLQGILV